MPKLTAELLREGYQDKREGPSIILKHKQISSLRELESLLTNQDKIAYLDFSFNLVRTIAPSLVAFTGLTLLDLSTNLLAEISGLETLTKLQALRLSRNRLTRITGLANNRNLQALDLSMNQITVVENIQHLTEMRYLYLYGNKITVLEGLHSFSNLKELRVEQNQIEDISILSLHANNIVEVQAHSNNIANLDDVIVTLSHLKKLKILSLYNNPVACDPTYRFRILKYKQVQNLDGLLAKDYIREVLEDIESDYDLDETVKKSQKMINDIIDREREVKETAVTLMKQQITQLEDDFIEFSRSLELELEQLNEYAAVIRTKRHLGEDIARDQQLLLEWKQKMAKSHEDRAESTRQRSLKVEQERLNYLKDKRANITFSSKLFEIAKSNPKTWREIKEEMWRKRVEHEALLGEQVQALWEMRNAPELGGELQQIDPETQVEIAAKAMGQVVEDLGGQMASEAVVRIEDSENRAAEKLVQKAKERKGSKACELF